MFLQHFPFMCCEHPTTRLLTLWQCKQSVLLLLCSGLCLEGEGGREMGLGGKGKEQTNGLDLKQTGKGFEGTRLIMLSFVRMLF